MIKTNANNRDCTVVDGSLKLRKLRQWKTNCHDSVPFYMHMGESGAVVFDGNPEVIRNLLRTYNTQKLFLSINVVSFLNSEGIAARRVSSRMDEVLGYHADISNN